ncbi:MAG: hypothetical protein M1831_007094 [Alyxoria varia]|nr:MAG: hypothetical protein M1831_007094 [Alyxoria varia]
MLQRIYPRAKVTADDRGPAANVVAWFLLCSVILSVFTRLAIKRFARSDRIISEDYAVVVALVMSIVHTIVLSESVKSGLGKPRLLITRNDLQLLEQLEIGLDILYLWIVALAKYATLELLVRLGKHRPSFKISCYAMMAFAGLWALAGSIAVGLQCGGKAPWSTPSSECVDLRVFWIVMEILNIISEVTIIAAPVVLVWNLQTSWNRKSMVITAFALRLSVIGAIIARVVVVRGDLNRSRSGIVGATVPTTNAALCVAALGIITACTPILKPFLDTFHSGVLGASLEATMQSQHNTPKGTALSFYPWRSRHQSEPLRSQDSNDDRGSSILLENRGPPHSMKSSDDATVEHRKVNIGQAC